MVVCMRGMPWIGCSLHFHMGLRCKDPRKPKLRTTADMDTSKDRVVPQRSNFGILGEPHLNAKVAGQDAHTRRLRPGSCPSRLDRIGQYRAHMAAKQWQMHHTSCVQDDVVTRQGVDQQLAIDAHTEESRAFKDLCDLQRLGM